MRDNQTSTCPGLTGSTIKLIAVVCMLLDHIAWFLLDVKLASYYFPTYPQIAPLYNVRVFPVLYILTYLFHILGRLAFPIFLFLITEGVRHTKNLRRYGALLLLFAVISEIPFDLCMTGNAFDIHVQNVFFTLVLCLIAITCLQNIKSRPILKILIIASCFIAGYLLICDYGAKGVLLACALEFYRENRYIPAIIGTLIFILILPYEFPILLVLPIIIQYNGKKGLHNKYIFYAFYPIHLFVLYAITLIVCR